MMSVLLAKTLRNAIILKHQTSKSVISEIIRSNKTFTHSIRIKNPKTKEPGEVIKWILLAALTDYAIHIYHPTQGQQSSSVNMLVYGMSMPVASFGLGCWQVYRLQWKLQLIDMLRARSNSEPVGFPNDFRELEKLEYRPVKVKGEFLHDKEFLIGPRALVENDAILQRTGSLISDPKKNQGWLVVTPFKLSDSGETILINRGWIPQSLRPKEKRMPSMVKGEVELTGVVRLTENRSPFMPKNNPEKGSWLYRDLGQMSAFFDCAPIWLDAKGIPDPPDGWPLPNQTRITMRNEHLSYLITWFMMSGFTGVMWHRYFIRKLPLI